MGQEIVYCYKCLSRLLGSDFDKGTAFRVGDRYSCNACVEDLLAGLPEAERQAALEGAPANSSRPSSSPRLQALKSDSSSHFRRVEPSPTPPPKPSSTTRLQRPGSVRVPLASAPAQHPRKSNTPVLVGGGVAIALVVLALLAMLPGGRGSDLPGDSDTPAAITPRPSFTTAPGTPTPDPAAKKALGEALALRQSRPDDFAGQVRLARAAKEACRQPEDVLEADRFWRDVLARMDSALEKAAAPAAEAFKKEELKKALDLLQPLRDKVDLAEWKERAGKKIDEMERSAAGRFESGLAKATTDRRAGNEKGVAEFRARLATWGLPAYAARFEETLAGVQPEAPGAAPIVPDKPVTKELLVYRERWRKAVERAAARDYAGATGELEAVLKDTQDAEARQEAEADLANLKLAAALAAEGLKMLAESPFGSKLVLEVAEEAGPKPVSGLVLKTGPRRLELKNEEDKSVFVELDAVTATSIAETFLTRRSKQADTDERAAAHLALLEGGIEAAKRWLPDPVAVPARWWDFAKAAAGKPRADAKELKARRLFHAAELEWRSVKTWGAAIDKYRQIQSECANTEILRREAATISARAETGKDYSFFPGDLRASGHFTPAKHAPKIEHALTSRKDAASDDEAKVNFIEAEFHALPDTAYRCWAYVGACCKETFLFYLQTTEGTTFHKGKDVPIDPGGGMAALVEPQLSGLAATHAKDKGGAKAARVWAWVHIPLPKKYAVGGAKTIRIMSDQQGFSVGYVLVSSTRKMLPVEAELKELAREMATRPPPSARGLPEPLEWFLAGPFPSNGLDGEHPPEKGIDLAKEMPGQGKNVKWKKTTAEMRAAATGKAGYFNFKTALPGGDNTVGYALIHVKAPAPVEVLALMGSDDGIKAWHNGRVFHRNDASRPANVDEDSAAIRLEPGWNRLLFKVRNGNGDFGLVVRLVHKESRAPVPDLEYSALGDLEEPK